MSLFEKYKLKRPADFTRLVGVNYAAFNIILDKLKNEIIRYRNTKLVRNRGLTSSLSIEDQLLLTLIYLGTSHYHLGKISEAEQILKKATNCNEGFSDEAFYNLGIVYGSQKKYQEALHCFEKAIEIDSKYSLAKGALKDVKKSLSISENK